jgi:predicted short-subunit dehydrogenase-like oxidoreductase (DUF2520 family)
MNRPPSPGPVILVGAGRAGTGIGLALAAAGFPVTLVSRDAPRRIGTIQALPHGDPGLPRGTSLWILAVPDRLVADTARDLARQGFLGPASVAGHLSGALPSEILEDAAGPLYGRFSAHPLLAFPPAFPPLPMPPGATVLIEGDAKGAPIAHALFGAAGAQTSPVEPDRKPLVHAAAVLSANLAAALVWSAADALRDSGVPDPLGVATRLLRSLVDNLGDRPDAAALTGPIARGDPVTVQANLRALDQRDPALGRLYRDLALRLADALHDAGTLPEEPWRTIRTILEA